MPDRSPTITDDLLQSGISHNAMQLKIHRSKFPSQLLLLFETKHTKQTFFRLEDASRFPAVGYSVVHLNFSIYGW